MKLSNEDYVARITSASPLGLVIINYELIIRNIDDATENASDEELFDKHAKKGRDLLAELILSLDMRYEVANNLMPLYLYVNGRFAEAIRVRKPDALTEARKILAALLESWKAIENQEENSTPVFTNAQKVYTGLTYGKNGANESYDNDSRGYTV